MVAARIGSYAGERRSCGQSREPAARVAAGRRCRRPCSAAGRAFTRREPVKASSCSSTGSATGPTRWGCRGPISSPPSRAAFRSGFWGTVPVPAARSPGDRRAVAGRTAGRRQRATWRRSDGSRIAEREPAPSPEAAGDAGRHRGLHGDLRPRHRRCSAAQVESLRAQTDGAGVCVISDDCSSARALRGAHRGDRGRRRASSSRAPSGGWASIATSSAR